MEETGSVTAVFTDHQEAEEGTTRPADGVQVSAHISAAPMARARKILAAAIPGLVNRHQAKAPNSAHLSIFSKLQ